MSGKKEKLKKSKPAENCTFLPPRVSDDGAVRLPAVKLIYLPFGIMVCFASETRQFLCFAAEPGFLCFRLCLYLQFAFGA